MSNITKTVQNGLLAVAILGLIFLLGAIGVVLAATRQGSTPARVDQITAGPYRFTVSLYDDPARAGLALPFAITPQGAVRGVWTYQVTSVPVGTPTPGREILMNDQRVATPIKDSVSPDSQAPGGVRGTAEISVQGRWNLIVVVEGPAGRQTFAVPVTATALPAIPTWLAWALGLIPAYGLVVFLMIQVRSTRQRGEEPGPPREESNVPLSNDL